MDELEAFLTEVATEAAIDDIIEEAYDGIDPFDH
jgi:hypothetical protein